MRQTPVALPLEPEYRPKAIIIMSGKHQKIPVGISSCLLGEHVRYDGGHTYDSLINTRLADIFEFRPRCPEVAIGLGVPRPAIKLFSHADSTRAILSEHPMEDVSLNLRKYAQQIKEEHPELCGYIFKSGSPSCGLRDVQTFDCNENPINTGKGIFADKLCAEIKGLPTIDEKQLEIPEQREEFFKSVATFRSSNTVKL